MSTPLQEQLAGRGVTAERLLEIGISQDRAVALLSGADPTIEEVRTIARGLGIPARPLIAREPHRDRRRLNLRENLARDSDLRDLEVFDLLGRAETLSILPQQPARRRNVLVTREQKTYESAEKLARLARLEVLGWAAEDPLIELERLLLQRTDLNILLANQRGIEGAALRVSGASFIFLAPRPDPRMRFTLAHELCHYLVDLGEGEDSGWFDANVQHVMHEDLRTHEQFANAFASALLLPASAVGGALNLIRHKADSRGKPVTDVELMLVARFFGVSFQAAGRRAEDLKLLPRGGAQAPERFAEEVGLPPRPAYEWGAGHGLVFEKAHAALRDGNISFGRLAEILEISVPALTLAAAR